MILWSDIRRHWGAGDVASILTCGELGNHPITLILTARKELNKPYSNNHTPSENRGHREKAQSSKLESLLVSDPFPQPVSWNYLLHIDPCVRLCILGGHCYRMSYGP